MGRKSKKEKETNDIAPNEIGSLSLKNIGEENRKGRNSQITLFLYIFIGLFVLCIGYFTYFLAFQGKDVINNSYNKRANLLAETIIRGSILSADGEKLAYSLDNGDGTETRVYPYNNLFAHVVGRYTNTKTGIEASEDFTMLTSSINLFRIMFHQLSNEKSPGDNVITTLDVDIQQVAYDALGNNKGAVVVMEPGTGRILAMVSKPDYDPNTVSKNWSSLIEDENGESALLNRATQGLYPPGSTFKIISLLSYMRQNSDYEDYEYICEGKAEFGDHTIHCYKNKVHKKESLVESFANSCNTSFANIGTQLDLEKYRKLVDALLYNTNLPLAFAYNKSSFVLDKDSNENEIAQTVIGQGKTLTTPMQNAMLISAIANGGNIMVPYLVDSIENANGNVVEQNSPSLYKNVMTAEEAGILTEYMEEVVKSGTAGSLNNSKYSVAGKTGTAEVSESDKPHAWFVGFAPTDKPEIVVSVVVENVGTGSDYAVPIAKKIFDAYYEKNK